MKKKIKKRNKWIKEAKYLQLQLQLKVTHASFQVGRRPARKLVAYKTAKENVMKIKHVTVKL